MSNNGSRLPARTTGSPPQAMARPPEPDARENFERKAEAFATRYLTNLVGASRGQAIAARFGLTLRTALSRNPKIAECSHTSVGSALALCLLTNLDAGGAAPQCYLIPRDRRANQDGKWVTVGTELSWQIGYLGLQELGRRAGYKIAAIPYYEGDQLSGPIDLMAEAPPGLSPGPARKYEMDGLIGGFVLVRRIADNKLVDWAYLDAAQIAKRRDASDSWKGRANSRSPSMWEAWFDEMVCKTLVIWAAKRGRLPMNDDAGKMMSMAIQADMSSDTTIEGEVVAATPAPAPRALPSRGFAGVREQLVDFTPAGEAAPEETLPPEPPPPVVDAR